MIDRIHNILVKYYGKVYGYDLCEAMAETIAYHLNDSSFNTRSRIQNYLWANTSGGGAAEMASRDIMNEFPMMVKDE